MVDNCMKQKVTLTGYDILDIIQAIDIRIPLLNEQSKDGILKLRSKLKKVYDNPKRD